VSTVQNVIDDVRVEINDVSKTRFPSDTTEILPMIKQAIRRANRICQRGFLHFAKATSSLTTVADTAYVTMPSDLDVPIGVWRDADSTKLTQVGEADWNELYYPDELIFWFLDLVNSRIYLAGTPSSTETLTIWYFPTVDPSAYAASSSMPWSGRLDDIIARYVAMRLQNVDEMTVATDENILADMETSILAAYAPQNPTLASPRGWL